MQSNSQKNINQKLYRMKKILLLVALVAGAFAAQAANGFTAVDNETKQEIKEGDVVYALYEDEFIPQYAAVVNVNSKTDEQLYMQIKIDTPEKLPDNFTYQFCWSSCYSPGNFPWQEGFTAEAAGVSFGSSWRLDIGGVTEEQLAKNYTMKVTLINLEDETDTLNFDLVLTNDAGVAGIEADNAEAVYYSLDGRRVVNPENGLYIVRRGNKVEKVMIRK